MVFFNEDVIMLLIENAINQIRSDQIDFGEAKGLDRLDFHASSCIIYAFINII